MNSRTCPKRRVSQPVSGSEMALATPKEVMTQVPWSGETPRSPAIAGIDTLAIDVSSTFMNVASDSAIVPIASFAPVSGGSRWRGGAAPARSAAGHRSVSILSPPRRCSVRSLGLPQRRCRPGRRGRCGVVREQRAVGRPRRAAAARGRADADWRQ